VLVVAMAGLTLIAIKRGGRKIAQFYVDSLSGV